jgi:hypothetical protein
MKIYLRSMMGQQWHFYKYEYEQVKERLKQTSRRIGGHLVDLWPCDDASGQPSMKMCQWAVSWNAE